jgi:hypothetical protein
LTPPWLGSPRQIEFMSEDEGEESLTVVIVEPGDALEETDAVLNHTC